MENEFVVENQEIKNSQIRGISYQVSLKLKNYGLVDVGCRLRTNNLYVTNKKLTTLLNCTIWKKKHNK